MNTIMVFIRPADNYYARYVNRLRDVRVTSDKPLTQAEVALFRKNPDRMLPQAPPPMAPEPRYA